MVKSGEDRYLAQIIEIYDDKFDSSQNVAKLKLFYKITCYRYERPQAGRYREFNHGIIETVFFLS